MRKILLVLSFCNILLSSSSQPYVLSIDRKSLLKDTLVTFDVLDQKVKQTIPIILDLVNIPFFRILQMNLKRPCHFWEQPMFCITENCKVEKEEENTMKWKNIDLAAVDKSLAAQGPFNIPCKSSKEFCYTDESEDGSYIDLEKNPERFTGFAGEGSHKVWRAIYEQNCFGFVFGSEIIITSLDNVCVEKRAFYRVVSGLHSSISIQLCKNWLNQANGNWESNLNCYYERVGKYDERLENLYFLYSILSQAVIQLSKSLDYYTFCPENQEENELVKLKLNEFYSKFLPEVNFINLSDDFKDSHIMGAFREHFVNITKIMDCVSCEKCKLWGKIQTSGIGTALKILFSFSSDEKVHLKKIELSTLFNVYAKISSSVRDTLYFEDQMKEINDKYIDEENGKDKRLLMLGLSLTILFLTSKLFF
jgi:ERO1-like protein beta